jgi:hypothetical protein
MQSLLPVLDKELATKEELIALKDLTFRTTVITMDSIPTGNNHGNTDAQTIDDRSDISVHMMPDPNEGRRCIVKCSHTNLAHLRVTGSTVLEEKQAKQRKMRFHGAIENDMNRQQVSIQFNMKELLTSIRPEFDISDTYINGDKDGISNFGSYSSHNIQSKDKHTALSSKGNFSFSLPPALLAEADDDTWNLITLPEHPILSDISVEDAVIDLIDDVATKTHGNLPPLGDAQVQESKAEVSLVENDFYRADDGCAETNRKSMFDGIWEQSYRDNVPNSAMDDKVSTVSITPESVDYNAVEEHSHFDGNPDLGTLLVSNYLDLYFDSFIFSKDFSEDQQRDLDSAEFSSPKIQMFKFDRGQRPHAMHFRERYIGVCKESVLACGSYARSRLPPKRIPKRTFHGDTAIRAGKDVMISESREYILCLSESALYFIIDDDIITKKTSGSKRSFPSRIPPNAVSLVDFTNKLVHVQCVSLLNCSFLYLSLSAMHTGHTL